MGDGWSIYVSEGRGQLPDYWWNNHPSGLSTTVGPSGTNDVDDFAWRSGNLIAILANLKDNPHLVICPEATLPIEVAFNKGFGTVNAAWSGQFQGSTSTPICTLKSSKKKFINDSLDPQAGGYRVGSYGVSRYMYIPYNTKKTPPGPDPTIPASSVADANGNNVDAPCWGASITKVDRSAEVPMITDAVWPDLQDITEAGFSGSTVTLPIPPSDVGGSEASLGQGLHMYRMAIARHGYGINILFADGHAQWVALPDITTFHWYRGWVPYTWSNLPKH